ncbi:hypothetical protein M438DRAFT_144251 [Aureobasidium pullulans EXF-150]|uniref:Uncharacterized protein n=1 Tax=Aureobasidium pullulans EXF-150 TaxID=1043002 RepID=A0A074XYA7_AURPU|nr:uncharacterized protein M438DRAFT_144251 [Aureobasidium pullulans EXF-150]KEQ79636.1 hypothetical protein M438DRAFT_144251 [Aureobasidium pullulans EXF-150]
MATFPALWFFWTCTKMANILDTKVEVTGFSRYGIFFLFSANMFDVGICIAKTKAASFFSASRQETAIHFLVATS